MFTLRKQPLSCQMSSGLPQLGLKRKKESLRELEAWSFPHRKAYFPVALWEMKDEAFAGLDSY